MSTDNEQETEVSSRSRITRRRAVHACNSCRVRKIRCNGEQPCTSCYANAHDCVYVSLAVNSKSKSDIILDGIHRMEGTLNSLKNTLETTQQLSSISQRSIYHAPSVISARQGPKSPEESIQNAVISSLHTSSTESVLQWPQFDAFPSLRQNYIPSFILEQSRALVLERGITMYPFIGSDDFNSIAQSFKRNVNFWYPTMSIANIHELDLRVSHEDSGSGTTSILSLLVSALGCASQHIETYYLANFSSENETYCDKSWKSMADMYFDRVLKNIHVAHIEMTPAATQCLFLVGLYFSFLQRPLQAWQYINAAATKCRLLLSYHPSGEKADDQECLRRIFWSCYILESDFLAELSALPQSGIAEIESSIPLPGHFSTLVEMQTQEQSSLYFLACISIRRLLNRVHNLLYAKDTGASFNDAQFPYIVSELHHQLVEWRDLLPPNLQFSVDTQPPLNQHAGFLRQRYLTCRSVIYRPYLSCMLANASSQIPVSSDVLEKSHICLDACLLHIMNLRSFAHTIMIDTWMCSLSMTAVMAILLAACRCTVVQESMSARFSTLDNHPERLFESWIQVPGVSKSPSVAQCLRIIKDINLLLQTEYKRQGT